ncbi:hypothetical protein [Streptomyces sp. ADI91-18]|uniref:hypothetical protein n=1 Tax=Streptomyces sp. ADI91-18 TaxID=1522755 RepID=UPI001F153CC3|nr:hypothetical protein [Streptomyces sp. ADI91-18]
MLARLASEQLIRAYDRSSYRVVGGETVPTPAELEPWTVHGSRTVYENRWVNLQLSAHGPLEGSLSPGPYLPDSFQDRIVW